MFERKCPSCGKVIKYKNKYNCRNAEEENRKCKSCMLKGRSQKDLYGDRYDEIIAKRSDALKEVEHTWHDKIANSRRENGTYKISEETRQLLRDNSYFSGKKGPDHPRIKKMLSEKCISFEEYLDSLSDYKKYKREVRYYTDQNDITILKNYDKRGKAGVVGAYHLVHIVEISEGFINGIAPEIIGEISNLQFIPWEKNMEKRKNPGGIKYEAYDDTL